MPYNKVFCFSLSAAMESKLRTTRPMGLHVRGLGGDMMSFTARWSWKRLVFSAIMYYSEQEYGTSPTTNDEGDHGET